MPHDTKVKQVVRRLLEDREIVRNLDVVRATGLTRQAVHRHLRAMVAAGELRLEGQGRSVRYRRAAGAGIRLFLPTAGLKPEAAWTDALARSSDLRALPEPVRDLFRFAITELVANVVDHAHSPSLELAVAPAGDSLYAEVVDPGSGLFAGLRDALGLATDLEALQELSKGGATRDPERHAGEGLYYVQRAADVLHVESGNLCWVVDNLRDDMAVGVARRPGTLVHFQLQRESRRRLESVLGTRREGALARARTVVKLFSTGVRFASRSEARRLLHGLERHREVILDFRGIELVGQGFADEVFRVWASEHPAVRLVTVNADGPVAFMVERAQGAQGVQALSRAAGLVEH